MKERRILFTPENAQKCHECTKTQTRRIVKPQPIEISWFEHQQGFCARVREGTGDAQHPAYVMVPCPYGTPGDRLWVRETWALWREGFDRRGHVVYRADMKDKAGEDFSRPDLMGLSKWYSSIHMKRVYSRLTLEITEIRVQRLQEISEEDAKAEGIERISSAPHFAWKDYTGNGQLLSPIHSYLSLWESINGPGSWDANPWVWAISFKKVQS